MTTPDTQVRILNQSTALADPRSLPLARLNPRRGHVERLAEQYRAVGFYGHVVFDRLTEQVVVGNHRVKAALLAEMPEIPVTYIVCDSPEHALRILAADNKLSDDAHNDPQELLALLDALKETQGGLLGSGYTEAEHALLLADVQGQVRVEGLTDADDAPPVPEARRVVSREGDLWQIGPHRIGCGSSTQLEHVRTLLDGQQPRLCWTDPPYNVNYEGKTKDRLKIANDAMTPEQFGKFMREAMRVLFAVLAPGACVFVAYAELEAQNFYGAFAEAGFHYSQTHIWVKNAGVLSRQDYNWRHEPIIFGWKPGAAHYFAQDFTQTTVLDETPDYAAMSKSELVELLTRQAEVSSVLYADKPARNDLHPTMKPVRIPQRAIELHTRPGELVFDPFGGSGSTLIAAHQSGRVCSTNDLDPRYVDVMVERLQAFSGLQAVRQDGLAYNELKEQVIK